MKRLLVLAFTLVLLLGLAVAIIVASVSGMLMGDIH